MSPPPPWTIVIAFNHQRFRVWCHENRRNPHEAGLMCVSTDSNNAHILRGMHLTEDCKIISYYDYWKGRYAWEVVDLLNTLEKTRRRKDG